MNTIHECEPPGRPVSLSTVAELQALRCQAERPGPRHGRRVLALAEAMGAAGAPAWETQERAAEAHWPDEDEPGSARRQRYHLRLMTLAEAAHAAGAHRRACGEIAHRASDWGEHRGPVASHMLQSLIEHAVWSADLPSAEAVLAAVEAALATCGLIIAAENSAEARDLAEITLGQWDWSEPRRAILSREANRRRRREDAWDAAYDLAEGLFQGDAGRPIPEVAAEVARQITRLDAESIADAVVTAAPDRTRVFEGAFRLAEAGAVEARRAPIAEISPSPADVETAPDQPFEHGGAVPPERSITPAPRAPLDLRPRLRSVTYDSGVEIAPTAWLAKGLLPQVGLGMLYGESSAGKTFLAVHLALCVAYGLPFFGRRVRQGGVVIVASEAGASVLTRLKAAERAMLPSLRAAGLTSGKTPRRAPIEVITEAPNLSKDGSAIPLGASIDDSVQIMRAQGHELGLVIVDTLHASMGGGDENSAADAAAVLSPLRGIAESLRCHVLTLHHPGKEIERGARGSYAFKAAMDAEISLQVVGCEGAKAKTTDALRRATVTKLRDGEAGSTFAYRLNVVEIAQDEDGDPLTTCTVVPVDEPPVAASTALRGYARDLFTLLSAMAGPDGSANLDRVRESFMKQAKAARPDARDSTHRMAWKRAVEGLEEAGLVKVDQGENRIQTLTP